ncbi:MULTISPECIES: GNAT family N-acetyltransferase [Thioclava]|uniref:GNAT family N-acetyltransferase n=1 Tax=Thioclava nitratireducens TaxID=1915078 RepID=A0ABM6IID5_9RHOB|nr:MULTISPECIES: GNAT family N-acetyltransferase [Thioclava]AQS48660.1 GNAT family N-acetyltransferase [Thioclava nitratireducens]OWY01584.1 GNAT family N-acetyltransferase [Thioclava sp. IC9]OWY01979.1 GNAT family N-acetyltransferase [Thioclava sp. F1Mire-8]OWY07480.1 GNAT family N-acetyltransferase [Thioclava sp. F42-5]OWY12070.1 GNAT family N-acetyltransferase [Thioclava sp. F34-6]
MYQETISTQPVIETERFVLRPLRRSDAGLIEMYSGDKRVAEGTRAIPHPLPPGTAENFITRAQADDRVEDVWAIDGSRHGMGELLGVVSLTRLDDDQSEIGYWVGPGFWNTGLASEAVAAIIEANPHKSRTLFAEVFQDNPGSARVLTNSGFEYLGDAESWSLARGRHVPTWTYLRKM